MTAKVSRLRLQDQASETSIPPNLWDFFGDLGRQQLALSMQSACAMFRGSQAVRHIQEQAAHHALVQHEKVLKKLSSNAENTDLMAIQSDLLHFDMSNALRYWQDLGQTAMKTQAEMMSCATQILNSTQDNGMKATMDKWQAMLTASLNGPAAWPTQSQ
jgi:predicted RNase H-like nuclease